MIKGLNRDLIATLIALIYINALVWSCKTHIFIAKEAGIDNPEIICSPDLAPEKEG